jgi:DNA mismatch repair protein MutS2
VPRQALRVVQRGGPGAPSPVLSHKEQRGGARGSRGGGVSTPGKSGVSGELQIIGRTRDEARDLLEKYLDDAFLAGLSSVRIIHGKGSGALRRAVEEVLSAHPLVAEHRPGGASEGGAGATIAVLSQS